MALSVWRRKRSGVVEKVVRPVALVGVTALAAALTGAVPALAAKAAFHKLAVQQERNVPGGRVTAQGPVADPAAAAALKAPPAAPVWPAVGTAVADLAPLANTPMRERTPAHAGGLPVLVDAAAAQPVLLPGSVGVSVLARPAPERAQRPVVLRLNRADGVASAGRVHVTVDYAGFRSAYGGDWANRLHLVSLPECALTAPGTASCQPTPIASTNNARAHTVAADVDLPTATAHPDALVALAAGPSGSAGSFGATTLAASSTWTAGGSTGDFSWTYPLRMPPSLGGPVPTVGLSYSSSAVDGRTAASNNQPSAIGEGFDFWPGYIERNYKPCLDDLGSGANNTVKTGDECWYADNATMSFNGHGSELVRDDATGGWHARTEDGSRVEHLTGAGNGDNDGEYWRITASDGTQYYFGLNHLTGWTAGKPETQSAWTVPVYGNNAGEPCHQATFAASQCAQAWRWNLDYVVDPDGNTLSYWYAPETNHYARNLTDASVSTYTRGGALARIDYGTRQDAEFGNPPMRVTFATAERCLPGSVCDFAHPASYPDVPLDLNCGSATSCPGQYSPTFWTSKRLASVSTQVLDNGGYKDVERWTLNHTYPDPGDSTRAGLWLASISHTGLVGGTTSLPDVKFTGIQLANRVDTGSDQKPAMNWWRVSYVDTEYGGRIGVQYAPPDCVAGVKMPASPESNTQRCLPTYWTPDGASAPVLDWFHKYVVSTVTETDLTTAAPRVITTYDYLGPAAWHFDDDDGLVPPSRKTWSQFRGYGEVRTTKGDPGEQQVTDDRYFRGMDGDHLSSGARHVTVADSQGGQVADADVYAGMLRESITYNGGAEVTGTVSDPWQSTPTASRTRNGVTVQARFVNTSVSKTRTALDAGRGTRTTEVDTTFDGTGQPTQVSDKGDLATGTDDRCTTMTYTRNTSAWIMSTVSRTESYALPCGRTPTKADDVLSDVRTSYDGQAYGAAPTRGDVTTVEALKQWPSTYVTTARSAFDAYGRETDAWDAAGNHTTTAYTPATGGPVTNVTTTNPLGWQSTRELAPAWGATAAEVDQNGKRTDVAYDPLGRVSAVWQPGHAKGSATPDASYTYLVRTDGPNAVVTTALNAAGNTTTGYQLLDGLLRERQSQEPAVGGGRVLTDQFYNTAGELVKSNGEYYNTDPPGTALFLAQDNQVPNQTVYTYDGAGRVISATLRSVGVEKWHTTTAYGGDYTATTPPAGDTASARVVDARGQTTELRQYKGDTPTGGYDTTRYGYTPGGKLNLVTDPAGNRWTTTYDPLGHVAQTTSPDRGATTFSYDDAGDVLTATDARGTTLAYTYDTLGRRTGEYDGSTSGTKLAGWTYDTLADGTVVKGQLATSTRYVNGNAYVLAARGYTDDYQETGATVTVPASEGALAGTYAIQQTYRVDGSPAQTKLPAAGGLPAETLTTNYDGTTGLPSTLTSNLPGTSGYVSDSQYTRFGELSVTTLSTGGLLAQTAEYYDEATRRVSETVTARETAPSTVSDVHYDYTAAGQVKRIADPTASDIQCFGHDSLGRTIEAWTPSSGDCSAAPSKPGLGGPAPYWQSWTFDATGNRLTQVDHASAGDATTTYAYPTPGAKQAHTLTGTTRDDATGTHTASYGYDAIGDTTSRPGAHGQQTLTWDAEGHLSTVTDSAGTTGYVYDANGTRLVAHDPAGTTLYLGGAMELRLNRSTNQVTGTRYYSFNDGVRAMRTPSGVTWLATDREGSVEIAIAANTQQASVQRETPYGADRGGDAGLPTDRGFVGGTADPTGLVHLGAREYDPTTGRFLSVDPVLDEDSPQQMNGYAYANNSPETTADPDGLCFWAWACKQVKKVAKAVSSGLSWVGARVNDAISWARDTARDVWNFAQSIPIVHRITTTVRRIFNGGRTVVRNFGRQMRTAYKKAVKWAHTVVHKAVTGGAKKASQAFDWIKEHGPHILERAWHVERFVINLPSTALGYVYAKASGADCDWYKGLVLSCTGATRLAPQGGQTIGNVFTTRMSKADVAADPKRMEHEGQHSNQFAAEGGDPISFAMGYYSAFGASWVIYQFAGPRHDRQGRVCDTSWACYNLFEINADLHKGGYYH